MIQDYFNRYELKYVLPYRTYLSIFEEMRQLTTLDPSGDEEGKYDVISLYYDSLDWNSYAEKIDGEYDRAKVRIRSYRPHLHNKKNNLSYCHSKSENPKDRLVFLEVKKKMDKTLEKKRARIRESVARQFIQSPTLEKKFLSDFSPIGKKLLYEVAYLTSFFNLRPRLVVTYTRQALFDISGPKTRITFDIDIKSRRHNLSLEKLYEDRYTIGPHHVVMEIKYTEFMPFWLIKIIQRYNCQLLKFSKYCNGIEKCLGDYNGMVY